MKLKDIKRLEKKEVEKILKDENLNKSNKMKSLWLGGIGIKEISQLMEVRYNFVYNVISNMIRVEGIDDNRIERKKKEGIKDSIIKLIKDNKSNIEISKELKVNYNYVWKVRNGFEKESIK